MGIEGSLIFNFTLFISISKLLNIVGFNLERFLGTKKGA
jgi:hypothetical protein